MRTQLEALLEVDQQARDGFKDVSADTPLTSQTLMAGATRIDPARETRNQRQLMAILARHGWPRKAQVGEKAMMGAFLVLQHAPLSLQTTWFPAVKASVTAGDLPAHTAALLEDRVLMRQGKPQIYGTQSVFREGRLWIWTIQEPERLEARRKAVGLDSMAEQVRPLGLVYPRDMVGGR